MKMGGQEESKNVADVRGSSGGFRPIHGIGLGTLAVALARTGSSLMRRPSASHGSGGTGSVRAKSSQIDACDTFGADRL
jgi:hypothetical protein